MYVGTSLMATYILALPKSACLLEIYPALLDISAGVLRSMF